MFVDLHRCVYSCFCSPWALGPSRGTGWTACRGAVWCPGGSTCLRPRCPLSCRPAPRGRGCVPRSSRIGLADVSKWGGGPPSKCASVFSWGRGGGLADIRFEGVRCYFFLSSFPCSAAGWGLRGQNELSTVLVAFSHQTAQ